MRLPALLLASSMLLGVMPAAADEPLKVVASFSILGDMTKQIGGDDVAVKTLVGPDGDAHVFEPSPQDARTLGEADVLVINGLEFETWLPRLARTAGFDGHTVTASDGVTPRPFDAGSEPHDDHEAGHAEADHHDHAHDDDHAHDSHEHEHEHAHGSSDPHAWQNLANGVLYARNITAALASAAPEHAADIQARGAAYEARLAALDAQIRQRIAAIPEDQRRIVTSHDAFGYFGDAYGIEFLAPEGVSTDAAASASDVAHVIDQIRSENITAVFVESMADSRVVERIASETGARVGGTLYSDSLSAADGPAPTYEAMFRHNADAIVSALATQ